MLQSPRMVGVTRLQRYGHGFSPRFRRLSGRSRKSGNAERSEGLKERPTVARQDAGFTAVRHQVEHRATEKVGIKVAERLAERVLEQVEEAAAKSGERVVEAAAKKVTGRTAAVEKGARVGGKIILKRWPTLVHVSERIVGRVGRGALIALPVVGGFFSAWIGHSDFRRIKLELKQGSHSAAVFFGGATLADGVDTTAHFLVAWGTYKGWPTQDILDAGSVSLVAAVVSTGAAVAGEVLSARRLAEEITATGAATADQGCEISTENPQPRECKASPPPVSESPGKERPG
ncbi:unnamed protein product [Discosporangium mesarthrocarpum]